MARGTPIDRQFILVNQNGLIVIDWGNGKYQDVYEGNIVECKEIELRAVREDELTILKSGQWILDFDSRMVYFLSLPQANIDTID
ncbi:MAG: hypothetical protein JEZ06_09350 [Anaerolineaceae bacterium]|nr:hypothetical protein [Anaerolineaceae bacterium]